MIDSKTCKTQKVFKCYQPSCKGYFSVPSIVSIEALETLKKTTISPFHVPTYIEARKKKMISECQLF